MVESETRAVVANEIAILLRQLDQVSTLLSSQTRDLGSIDSDIRSLNKSIDEIKSDLAELFGSRNKFDRELPVIKNSLEDKIRISTDSIESITNKMTEIAPVSTKVKNFDIRISSIEGHIKKSLEEKAEDDIAKKEERINQRSTQSKRLWDLFKMIMQMAVAAAAAYVTVKMGKL